MCWSSAFDPFEGSTLGSKSVPGGRTDRSREPSRARAVRRLGVPVGMGGKANCLCLRGIWETPKPRYREETKPVVKLPGTTFRAKDPACHARSWGRDTAARRPRGRAPSEETHLRREARASFARCLGPAVRVPSPSRPITRPARSESSLDLVGGPLLGSWADLRARPRGGYGGGSREACDLAFPSAPTSLDPAAAEERRHVRGHACRRF